MNFAGMRITVYLGSNPGKDPAYARAVEELGAWIGEQGMDLVYGGSRVGLMGILAEAVLRSGGKVIGVEPRFFVESAMQHEGITELIVTETMAERKTRMMELGDAYLAFPGGTGTLEEISEIMSHNSIGLIRKPCILYNLRGYYNGLRDQLDHMKREGFLLPENRDKVHFAEDLEEIASILRLTVFHTGTGGRLTPSSQPER